VADARQTSADERLTGHLATLAARVEILLSAATSGDEETLAAQVAAVSEASPEVPAALARYDAGLLLDAASEAADRIGAELAKHEALAKLFARRAAEAEAEARVARAQLAALDRVVVVPLVSSFGSVPRGKKAVTLAGELARCSLHRSRHHVVVDPAALVLLPADCRRVTVAPDKEAIKDRLERGEALPGCTMEPGALRVRWGNGGNHNDNS
jgi:hypothetical protein